MAPLRIAAVIPARMRSSRFPGKALLQVRGVPMVEHVRRRTVLSRAFDEVVVATCDDAIAEVVRGHGGRVVMTSPDHAGALDRVAEAIRSVECTHVVNVQGDEILILPDDLRRVAEAVRAQPEIPAWNAVASLDGASELSDPSIVKLVMSMSGRVMFCARDASAIPCREPGFDPIRKSIGIMALTRAGVEQFTQRPRTTLERATSIDQLRWLEHDLILQTVWLQKGYPTINEPREVPLVEAAFAQDRLQQAILEQVLT